MQCRRPTAVERDPQERSPGQAIRGRSHEPEAKRRQNVFLFDQLKGNKTAGRIQNFGSQNEEHDDMKNNIKKSKK
jgi:hypothetical protein